MESLYQLPPLYANASLTQGQIPLYNASGQPQLYNYMPTSLAEAFAYPYLRYDAVPQSSTLEMERLYLEAALAGMRMHSPASDFLSHLPPLPRLPLADESLNVPRPYRPTAKPAKIQLQAHFSGNHLDIPSWRARASEENQNVQPEKDNVRKTIYITDVDQQITEEQLANFFKTCGDVVDCRVCGDPNSAMRFAFVEFATDAAAATALHLNGTVLGDYPLRVLPSKTAIVPVNTQYLPKTVVEREKCSRTIYAANIDKKVDRESVKLFFETICGAVGKIRLLGDWQHSTRIAFVEFINAESAKLALGCSGALLGSLPIRVSPSKTPVRDDPASNEKSRIADSTGWLA